MAGEGTFRHILGHLFGQSPPIAEVDLLGIEIDIGPNRSGFDLARVIGPSFGSAYHGDKEIEPA